MIVFFFAINFVYLAFLSVTSRYHNCLDKISSLSMHRCDGLNGKGNVVNYSSIGEPWIIYISYI